MYHPLAFAIAFSHLAAAIALLNGMLTTLGQGNVAANAVAAIARQPEAKGSITTTMFIGCGFAETAGVYGLLIAFLLIFVNPLVNNNIDVLSVPQQMASLIMPFFG
ncbi:MAG: ATP synthase F0 subunit C [Defluviitaleaceae bacterium]|nr:ATP synthase F0 subunit C [Defluviitaleaceae bacterium]